VSAFCVQLLCQYDVMHKCLPTDAALLFCRRSNNYGGGGGFNVWVSPTDFFFFTVCTFYEALDSR
jgi:hypothetical protein